MNWFYVLIFLRCFLFHLSFLILFLFLLSRNRKLYETWSCQAHQMRKRRWATRETYVANVTNAYKIFEVKPKSKIKEDITKCSNELNNKLTRRNSTTNIYWRNIGYMFRPVNRSSSGLHRNKSQVLFRYWDPNIFTIVNVHKNWYWNIWGWDLVSDIGD